MNLNTETFTPVLDQDMDMNHRPGSRPFSLSVNKPLETHGKNNKKQFTLKWSDEMSTFDGHVPFVGPRIPLFWTSGTVAHATLFAFHLVVLL